MDVFLTYSNRSDKKYAVIINGHTINFGAFGYEDYTMHHDQKRKENYLKRHASTENWNDYMTAGFWSRWLLWNKPTILESIYDIESHYPLIIHTEQ